MTLKTAADDKVEYLLQRIYGLMAEVVPGSVRGQPDLALLAAGIDSMGLILLTTRIEAAFDIEFAPEHLTVAELKSPVSIARLLHEYYHLPGKGNR
jgi:acyl carrier protein